MLELDLFNMAELPPGIKQKYVPHKTLREGWTYVSIPDENIVIGIRAAVTKVMKLTKPDGTPVLDAAGNPSFSFQSVNVAKVLTNTEYDVVKKMEFGE